MTLARKRRPRKSDTLKPVRVNAAVQQEYRAKLQASNQKYKKVVNRKVNTLLAQIDNLDRSKPGAFQKQVAKLQKSIDGLQRNLDAANKRSEKAVKQFVRKMEQENTRRTLQTFGSKIDTKLAQAKLDEKQAIVNKRITALEKRYLQSIHRANRDYSDRVQAALYEKLGNPRVNARKKITRAKGIVTRRIKNTVTDQAHELNTNMNRTRQRALGAKGYKWQSKEDDKVRNTHVENNQKVFSWSKRPVLTGHPGEDHGCRCNAMPIMPPV